MLKGIGKLQAGACAMGVAGLALAMGGSAFHVQPLVDGGFASFSLAAMGLVVSGSRRTNLRTNQIRASLARLEAKEPRPVSSTSPPADFVREIGPVWSGSEFEYARRMETIQSHLETFALRSRSRNVRDSFARHATTGQLRYAELIRQLAVFDLGCGSEEALASARRWRASALLALARIAVNQRATESDIEDSVRIFAFVEKNFGIKSLGRTDRLLYLEALGTLGARRSLAAAAKRFRINNNYPVQGALLSLNTIGVDTAPKESAWTTRLNRLYESNSLAHVSIAVGDGLPIDRLRTAQAGNVEVGPLVSVIMPTHNGSELISTALESLLSQTWRNLEVIVVDDFSDETHFARLQELCAVDARISLLRQPQNLGAYCARNLGLSVAKGEFVTVHDDDDWSHAQKIELQVRGLLDNPEIQANMSQHARCTPELEFLRINNNPQFTQPNFSSLLVRRSVFQDIGGWDAVNRGADAEFRDRLVASTGQAIPVVGGVPLSFTRTRIGSLTSDELVRGYVDSARLLYMAAYQAWHRQAVGSASLNGAIGRPFPVPKNMEPGLRGKHLGGYDVVFGTDFRFPGGTSSLTLAEIRAASDAGLKVGIIQLDSPLNKFSAAFSAGLLDVLSLPRVDALTLNDRADVALLVIRHPSVATFLDGANSNLTVQQCILIVNNPPVLRDGSGMVFDLPTCIENLDSVFTVKTTVVAESGLTRKLCNGLIARDRLSNDTWPGMVTSSAGAARIPHATTPVLGRHSRDHELKWPSKMEDFTAAYKSQNGQFKTVFLGGGEALIKKFGADAPAGLTIHPYGTVDVPIFLETIHFWAYFHDDRLTESFGMAAAEAMAAGKVVLLPKYMEATFGEGAIYCSPKDVAGLVAKFTNDPTLYKEQSDRAREVVLRNFSPGALVNRIAKFSNPAISRTDNECAYSG